MDERTVEVLKELFGSVSDEETIKSVAKFYNGSLNPSIEALMKLTNSNQIQIDGSIVNAESTQNIPISGSNGYGDSAYVVSTGSNMSYRSAFDKNKQKEFKMGDVFQAKMKMAVVKNPDILNVYSNKKYIEKTINCINEGHRVLVLMRGLPGSGKSTLAKSIIKLTVNNCKGHIFSSDDFFMTNGKYIYNRDKIGDAHEWNQKRVMDVLSKGVSPVIVDNTNLELWEMQVYATKGVVYGYYIEILEAQTPWSNRHGELARKSVHNIPAEKIKRMQEKFVKNISGNYLLDYFRIRYPPNMMPPQERCIPKIKSNPEGNRNQMNNIVHQNEPIGNMQLREQQFHFMQQNVNISAESSVTSPVASTSSATGYLVSKQSLDDELKHKFDLHGQVSKPQRSNSESRRNGFLKNFTDVSEWKSISDWECVDSAAGASSVAEAINSSEQVVANACNDTSTQTVNTLLEDQSIYKQLIPVSRSINLLPPVHDVVVRPMFKCVKLDKGIMTDDDISISSQDILSRNEKIKELKTLFEHIPNIHLRDILERCNGDVNWACEILLDANINGDNLFTNDEQEECDEQEDEEQNCEWVNVDDPGFNTDEETNQADELAHSPSEEDDKKKERNLVDINNLKRQIEENFVIADNFYSEHVLQLRKKIHGEKISESDSCPNTSEEFTTLTSDESTDSSKRNDQCADQQDAANGDVEEEELEDEEVETVSVRVGHDFIGELNRIYKTPSYDCSLEPVIHMPATLLDQIHALWIESLCNQIDVQKENTKAFIQEDEDFARMLLAQEEEEEKQGHESEVPNLREIMEMEMDLARYNMAHSQWKKESPNDLATKLSKQKLIKLFPDLNENVLMEVLHAYDYNFGAAFEDLLVSTGVVSKSQSNEIDPKELQRILAEQEKDLIERALKEKNKELAIPDDLSPSTSSMNRDPKGVVEVYRQEAKELMSLRNQHHAKAQEYFNRKMFGTANYYSNLANLYTKKHDYINSLAASEIVQINTKDNNTLDLHCFFVKEALQALDLYLDQNIRALRERNKKPFNCKIFLITGRGMHSLGQIARIKPAIKRRLKERNLRYAEVNPGLLSVIVTVQDVLTDSM